MQVGTKISWHIRPEIIKEFGGYMEAEPMTGTVISVHEKHMMARQDNDQRKLEHILACSRMIFAVDKLNVSINILE